MFFQKYCSIIHLLFVIIIHLQNSVALNIYYSRAMEGGLSTESYTLKGYDSLVTIYNDKDKVIDQVQ